MKIIQPVLQVISTGVSLLLMSSNTYAEVIQRLDSYERPSVSASDLTGKGLKMNRSPSSATFPMGGQSSEESFEYQIEYLNQVSPQIQLIPNYESSQSRQLTPNFSLGSPDPNSSGRGFRGIPIRLGQ